MSRPTLEDLSEQAQREAIRRHLEGRGGAMEGMCSGHLCTFQLTSLKYFL